MSLNGQSSLSRLPAAKAATYKDPRFVQDTFAALGAILVAWSVISPDTPTHFGIGTDIAED